MHIPVLKREALEEMGVGKNKNFIDATFGEGGHAKEILEKIKPKGKLLAIEKDDVLYKRGREMNLARLTLYNDSYLNLKEIVEKAGFKKVAGVLFDLGFCTFHLQESKRGFSFQENEPLDMRYSSKGLTAKEIVNYWKKEELEKILKDYGEERYAKRIALEIIKTRKEKEIETTFDLIEIIKRAIPRHRSKINFATRTFQALRIAVNNELKELEKGLSQALDLLEERGKIVVISFHSLEDRIVKNFFKDKKIKSKLIFPTREEIKKNKKARSAKLRSGEKNE